jgi:hypothetical protein
VATQDVLYWCFERPRSQSPWEICSGGNLWVGVMFPSLRKLGASSENVHLICWAFTHQLGRQKEIACKRLATCLKRRSRAGAVCALMFWGERRKAVTSGAGVKERPRCRRVGVAFPFLSCFSGNGGAKCSKKVRLQLEIRTNYLRSSSAAFSINGAESRWSRGLVKRKSRFLGRGNSLIFKVGNPLGNLLYSPTPPTN